MGLKTFYLTCAEITCDKCGGSLPRAEKHSDVAPGAALFHLQIWNNVTTPSPSVQEEARRKALTVGWVELGFQVQQGNDSRKIDSRWLCSVCKESDPEWQVLRKLIEKEEPGEVKLEAKKMTVMVKAPNGLIGQYCPPVRFSCYGCGTINTVSESHYYANNCIITCLKCKHRGYVNFEKEKEFERVCTHCRYKTDDPDTFSEWKKGSLGSFCSEKCLLAFNSI